MLARKIEKIVALAIFFFLLKMGFHTVDDSLKAVSDLSNARTAMIQMHHFDVIFSSFYVQFMRYPDNVDEFFNWLKQHYDEPMELVAMDPWRNSYWFLHSKWEIRSAGPDLKYQNADDLVQPYPDGYIPANLSGGRGVWLRSQSETPNH